MFSAGIKDEEQMGHASLLKEGLCRHVFIISFESMTLTGLNEWVEEEDILHIPLRTLNESLLRVAMTTSCLSSHTFRTILTFV